MKIPQFLPDQAESWAILPIHGIIILTKFQVNWANIVDFSFIAYFRTSAIFYDSVFKYLSYVCMFYVSLFSEIFTVKGSL